MDYIGLKIREEPAELLKGVGYGLRVLTLELVGERDVSKGDFLDFVIRKDANDWGCQKSDVAGEGDYVALEDAKVGSEVDVWHILFRKKDE